MHHAHCPVAVIHAEEAQAPDHTSPVLLGIDGSPASEAATALAFDEASRRGVDLVALHAWSDIGVYPVVGMYWQQYEDEGHEVLAERLAGWQEQYPDVQVQRRIVCDQPARWLSMNPNRLSWSWSEVTAAAGSPACFWVRSAPLWPKGRRLR